MRRALAIAIVLAAGTAVAEEPAAVEDPKQAMRDRGVVRKAGKKHYVIIVPPAPGTTTAAKDSVLSKATLYFGTLDKMRVLRAESYSLGPPESRALPDARDWYGADIERNADLYTLVCTALYDTDQPKRRIELPPVEADAAEDVIERAKLLPALDLSRPFLLARVTATTYIYVDRRGTKGTNYRAFLGKRGAMKPIKIKEIADDSDALSIVTAKGTLTVKWAFTIKDVTWGGKKPAALKVLDLFMNRALIRDLGVYTKEPSGHPCHEL